ncbi:hypothetical protein FRC02_006970 [Tulasnella sp. 418]|nr:hypothetical protein FRC02_006970 [Tulasnella sp. 418]
MAESKASGIHLVAQTGFGEGTNELYDRARPTYPSEQLSYIQSTAANPDGPLNIIELGSGTGIFTRALLAHPSLGPVVHELRAIEPSAGMRAQFSAKVEDERVSCSEGTFERTGAPDEWADLVIVAQAWHWCPDFDKALAEISRVLKPNGVAILIWNLEDNRTAWVKHVRDAYERYENSTPQFRLGLWRKTFEVPTYARSFKDPIENLVSFAVPTTASGVIDRVCSKSYITILPDKEKNKLVEELKNILNEGEGRVWVDESQGVWEYPYTNLVVAMKKK